MKPNPIPALLILITPFLGGCVSEHLGPVKGYNGRPDCVATAIRDGAFLANTIPFSYAIPFPSFKRPVQSGQVIKADELGWLESGQSKRSDIIEKLGQPWTEYPDFKVMVYYWETRTGYWLRGPIPIIPTDEIARLDYFFVRLDSNGRVVAHTFAHASENKDTIKIVSAWVDDLWVKGVINYRTFEPDRSDLLTENSPNGGR